MNAPGQRPPILKYFGFHTLSLETQDRVREMRARFATFANELGAELPVNEESRTAYRKLLEAKDAAVRALL